MEIKDVKLLKKGDEDNALQVTLENGDVMIVPIEPENRHYQEAAAWYKAKKTKPFKFTFRQTDRKKVFGEVE